MNMHMKGLPDPDEVDDMGKNLPGLRTEEPCRFFPMAVRLKELFLSIKRNAHLSMILIAFLVHEGGTGRILMEILNKALEDSHDVFCKTRAALKVAEKYGQIDDNFLGRLTISFGMPFEESYLRYRLSVLMKEENNSLRKGRIYIHEPGNLMGIADPQQGL